MGVQGLWKLLECSGRPVNPETLEGKILAVDISIWLNQAVKGARDRHGNAIQNAHLLTLFHRLCKLLFFRIRPIFVFDGEAPLLKRQTLAKRRYKKNEAASEAKKTNDKLLRTFLKRQAIKAALSRNKQSTEDIPKLSQVRRKDEEDIYVLPSLEENERNSSEEEEEKEWEERMSQKTILQEEYFANPHSIDIESEDFHSLPPEVKHEMLTDMKEFTKRRRTLFEAMPEDSNAFSQYQLQGLLKKNNLNKCIDNVRKEMNQQYSGEVQAQLETEGGFIKEVETQRLVSEDTSHYILIKGIQSKKEDKKEDSSAQPSSSIFHETTPKTYLDMKLASAHKPKIGPSSAFKESPPSPGTLFAIEQAMMVNSSEEELEEDKGIPDNEEKPSTSVNREECNISPRTLKAIQQVLAEDEAGERGKKRIAEQSKEEIDSQQHKTKVLVTTSPDKEEKDLGSQARRSSAPAISLANIEFSPSPTQINRLFGNNQPVLNNIPVSKKGEPEELDRRKGGQTDVLVPSILAAKRNLFYDNDKSIPSLQDSQSGDASLKVQTASPTASVMPSLVGNNAKPGTEILDSSKVFTSTTQSSALHPCNKLVVEVETDREDLIVKPSTSLGTSSLTSPRASDLLLVSLNTQTVSSRDEENRKLSPRPVFASNVELVESKGEQSGNNEVLGINVANPAYLPLTPESIEENEEEIESDSDGSFIEVDSDLSNIKAAGYAADNPEIEGSSSIDEKDSSKNESSFTGNKDAQPGDLPEDEDSRDVEAEVNEWQDISLEELELLENNLYVEQTSLQAQKQQQERVAASVTGQMCLESQELLRLFGIPYLVAPMEAEAQCAVLDLTDQTSGTITDDSDIWLFGARHVYKNFFSQNKYVEYYQFSDIHNQLGLDRSKLINLAYLMGSDYTEGIPTVGYVSAMEILNEFPGQGLESLIKFKEWWTDAQKKKKIRSNPNDTKVKKKLRELEIHPAFPNKAVADAYLKPVVDDSKGAFSWGRPDLDQIREFCESRFGWYRSKTDEVLLPVMKQLNSQQTQLRIDSFFRAEHHEAQALKSQRLRRAVTCMKRKLKEGESAEVEEATALMEKECKAPKQNKAEKTPPGKCKGGKGKKPAILLQETDNMKEGGGFIEKKLKTSSPTKYCAEESESKRDDTAICTKTSREGYDLEQKKGELSGSSSSSSEDEEIKTILVTARPVFQGNAKKSKNTKGKKPC